MSELRRSAKIIRRLANELMKEMLESSPMNMSQKGEKKRSGKKTPFLGRVTNLLYKETMLTAAMRA